MLCSGYIFQHTEKQINIRFYYWSIYSIFTFRLSYRILYRWIKESRSFEGEKKTLKILRISFEYLSKKVEITRERFHWIIFGRLFSRESIKFLDILQNQYYCNQLTKGGFIYNLDCKQYTSLIWTVSYRNGVWRRTASSGITASA